MKPEKKTVQKFQRDYDRLIFSAPFRRFAKQDTSLSFTGKYLRTQPTDTQPGSFMRRAFARQ